MAIIGIQINKQNPEFTAKDFSFWMPQYKKYVSFYKGKILLGSTTRIASIYSTDYSELFIDNTLVEMSTSDEIIYNGSITISSVTYSLEFNSTTKVLSANVDETTTFSTLTSEGSETFEQLYEIANNKIFKSVYGTDWKLAMSLCVAHYLTLIADQNQAPAGNTLQGIAGGGVTKGVLSSMSVGAFSKSYDINKTMVSENEAMFWNQTSYGAELMALLKTKAIPSIMVVTSHFVPGAN